METTNLELIDNHQGLLKLGELKIKKDDTPEIKALIFSLVSRVGLALKKIKDEVEQYGDQHNALITKHAKRDNDGNPIPMLDDVGRRSGIELENVYLFNEEHRLLLKTKVTIPDNLGKVRMTELLKVGFDIDGNLASMLGDFLVHDLPVEATYGQD